VRALALALVWLLWLCACRPKVGDACRAADVTCGDDGKSAIACVSGRLASVVCGGPRGCAKGSCDQSRAEIGDACVEGATACASDAIRSLKCESGRFVLGERCGGAAGCVVGQAGIACDTSAGAPGDPCRDAGKLACAPDGKAIVRCDGTRFVATTTCRGPSGCAPRADGAGRESPFACDDSLAEAGDACDLAAQIACSVDRKVELRCADGKFAVARVCRTPCEVRGDDLFCD
jgi:hypothetical protein